MNINSKSVQSTGFVPDNLNSNDDQSLANINLQSLFESRNEPFMHNNNLNKKNKNTINERKNSKDINISKESFMYNGVLIGVLSILYILLITKLADILTSGYEDQELKIERYVMIIFFISIMGLVIGYIWLSEISNGNKIIKNSLSIGGILMLIYTIINYWEYLDDYAKLIMIALSISIIIYYIYQ